MSSTVRSIDQWADIFRSLPTSMADPAEVAVAHRIFGDLLGYRDSSKHRREDAMQLSNAMQAYARIVQEAGVKA